MYLDCAHATLGRTLKTMNLVGDGDEVAAIEAVERAFGVVLDVARSSRWVTAGDVFDSLLDVLPPGSLRADAWPRFTEALASENDVDAARITMDTRLLGPGIPVMKCVADLMRRVI